MSRITTDLFDITELMHHGPENVILSVIKITGAFVILLGISPALSLAAFIVLPFMFLYAYFLNGKMRRAFKQNRVRIAEINAQIESIDLGSGGNHGTTTGGGSASDNVVVGGSKDYEGDYTSGYIAKISELVAQMRENSSKWHTVASAEERNRLHEDSVQKAAMISRLGVTASYDPAKGAWTIVSDKWNPSNIGKNLLFSYHTGGIAGNQPTLKQNEIMAVLEKGKAVLDAKKEKTLYRMIDFTTTLSEKFAKAIKSLDMPRLFAGMSHFSDASKETPGSVSSAQTANIQFGDVYIYGASEETVEKHRAVTREQTNAILSHLNIKR